MYDICVILMHASYIGDGCSVNRQSDVDQPHRIIKRDAVHLHNNVTQLASKAISLLQDPKLKHRINL